jgi:hypothetical protein
MRGRPCPLHLEHRTSASATLTGASGRRRFTVRSISITVSQPWQTSRSQWCFVSSAAAIVGQN